MAAVRLNISMDRSLLDQADRAAHRLGVSRSKLLSLALEDFLVKRCPGELTRRINKACQAPPDEEDQAFFRLAASSVADWGKGEKW